MIAMSKALAKGEARATGRDGELRIPALLKPRHDWAIRLQ